MVRGSKTGKIQNDCAVDRDDLAEIPESRQRGHLT